MTGGATLDLLRHALQISNQFRVPVQQDDKQDCRPTRFDQTTFIFIESVRTHSKYSASGALRQF
jgi:hypothetical protein